MRRREGFAVCRRAAVAALVLSSIVLAPLGPASSGSIAWAQAGCGLAALGDDPGEDGFQIDGQFYSGPDGDDWAQGPIFAGVLLNGGTPHPDYLPTLHERDENCAAGGDDCSMFTLSNKNNDDISPLADPWNWTCGSTPQKNDLTDLYAHARVVEVAASTEVWLVLGAVTRALAGDSHIDFEWNVAGLEQVGTTFGEIIGHGPHAGRTADIDFIVSVDLQPIGVPPVLSVRRWTYVGAGAYEYVLFTPPAGKAFICADFAGAVAPPWGAIAPEGTVIWPPGTLAPGQFVEAAVELTSIGIDPADLEPEQATLIFKTRSSASFTAELKDFGLYPFSIMDPATTAGASYDLTIALHPPLPNPASGATTVRFNVPDHAGPVRLAVYDVSGRFVTELLDGPVPSGRRDVTWDGTNAHGQAVASGVYYVRLTAGGQSLVRRVVLLR
jgi:hypothetical protein